MNTQHPHDLMIGQGTLFRSLTRIQEDLGIPGLTVEGVRELCHAVGAGCQLVAGQWYVNVWYLQIGLTIASRLFREDFIFPGNDQPASSLTKEDIIEHLPRAVAEIVAFRRASLKENHEDIRAAAKMMMDEACARTGILLLEHAVEEALESKFKRVIKEHGPWIKEIERSIRYASSETPPRPGDDRTGQDERVLP